MLDANQIISIVEEIQDSEEKVASIFNKIITTGLQIQQNSEELLEECHKLFINHDTIFQFTLNDGDFDFFLKIIDGTITYDEGMYQGEDIPMVIIEFPKEIMIQVLRQEVRAESLYSKGIIKVRGSISKLMRLRALGLHYLKYLDIVFLK